MENIAKTCRNCHWWKADAGEDSAAGGCWATWGAPATPSDHVCGRWKPTDEALVKVLEWLVNLGYGVGKAGGAPEDGEFEDAIEAGKAALAKAKEA